MFIRLENQYFLFSILIEIRSNMTCKNFENRSTGEVFMAKMNEFWIGILLIMKTSPCNEHPITPHFYIVKMGLTGVYIFFSYLCSKH